MPRLQLATRMVREQAVHSGHGRSLTREGNTLDRTITVAAGGTSARGGMFVLPVSPSWSRYANFLSVADVLREEDGSPQLADWKQMYDNVFYVSMNINQYSTIIVCREALYKIVDKQA